jgi:hypothetical protein
MTLIILWTNQVHKDKVYSSEILSRRSGLVGMPTASVGINKKIVHR